LPVDDKRISFLQPGMYITTGNFEKQIQYLVDKYNIINLEEYNNEEETHNTCVITFDDGWEDNYKYAYPILKRYGVKATIFLTTSYINSRSWPWTDKLCFYIHNASFDKMSEIFRLIENEGYDFNGGFYSLIDTDRFIAAECLISELKKYSNRNLLTIMSKIDNLMEDQYRILEGLPSWLDWDQIKEMRQNGIRFGAHTHKHFLLTKLSIEEAHNEIIQSKKLLQDMIGAPVNTFSYPNGYYNDEIISIVKQSGFTHAVTTHPGLLTNYRDQFKLPRFLIHNDISKTILMFACKLTNSIPYFYSDML